jgi:hypothetical protein
MEVVKMENTKEMEVLDEKDVIKIELTGKYADGKFAVISRNERNEDLAKNYCWKRQPDGYVVNNKLGYLHKVVKGFKIGDEQKVDHYDKNRLNMVDSNLIIATNSQQSFNRNHPVGKSGRTGVRKGTGTDKWEALIYFEKKYICLGFFSEKEDAIKAREEAEKKYYGKVLQNNTVYVDPKDKPKVKFEGQIVHLPLDQTEDKSVKYTKIDRDKYDIVKQFDWYEHNGRVRNGMKGYLHQFLMDYCSPKIDHKNQDPLDNRIANLRPATSSENGMNRSVATNNTSGTVGVHFNERDSLWRARIVLNNEHILLGSWKKVEDAIKIRQYWEQKLFGEFSPNKDIVVAKDEEIAELMKTRPKTKAFKDCNFDPKQISKDRYTS